MPTPQRTSQEQIVEAATQLVAERGLPGLTMQAVAERVGVRAPSLYKRVRDRDHLIALVIEAIASALGDELERSVAAPGLGPRASMHALADGFRAFARAHPAEYAALFTPVPDTARPDSDVLRHGSSAVLRVASALAGERDALEAARTITAWAHGFIDMELAGAFRLGGDSDRAFRYGIERLTDAVAGGLRTSVNEG